MYIQIKKYEKIKNCTAGEVGRLCMTTTSFKFMLYCSVAEVGRLCMTTENQFYVKLFKNFPDLRIRPFIFSKY